MMLFSLAVCWGDNRADCGLVKDAPCVVLGGPLQRGAEREFRGRWRGCLHYSGYLIAQPPTTPPICKTHSNTNGYKPITVDSPPLSIFCGRIELKKKKHDAGLKSVPLEYKSPPPPGLARPRQCNSLAISVPGEAAPFKGSSQHDRLMQRDGRLKARQPSNVALKQQLGKKRRSQIISLLSTIPLSGIGGGGVRVWRVGGRGSGLVFGCFLGGQRM